jgi:hypothetical protein
LLTLQVPNLISIFFLLRRFPGPTLLVVFRNKLILYSEELLAPHPTPKLEDHPLSAVRDCLFSISAATLQNWRASPPSATWGRAMPWWQGTHLTWNPLTHVISYCRVSQTLWYCDPLNQSTNICTSPTLVCQSSSGLPLVSSRNLNRFTPYLCLQ